MSSHVWERLRPHWPFTLVTILGLALVLSNLGKDYLWADELKGLPTYVFDVDQVRWVIWRPVWEGYHEYFGAEVEQQIVDRGGRIERVAELPETLWENRGNIHFRRFPGGRYLFHGPETFPPATIFRVVWPTQD
jgi:hypothetical protein